MPIGPGGRPGQSMDDREEPEAIDDDAFRLAALIAEESGRADPLVVDPYASHLAGTRGARMLTEQPVPGQADAIALSTAVVDEVVCDTVMRQRLHTVVHVGAGLDTRPFRLQLPSDLRWIELDRNTVLLYKGLRLAHLTPGCRVERVAADVSAPTALGAALRRACVGVARGLLITENALGQFSGEALIEMGRRPPRGLKWWILSARYDPADEHAELLREIRGARWEVADYRPLDREARRRPPTRLTGPPAATSDPSAIWLLHVTP